MNLFLFMKINKLGNSSTAATTNTQNSSSALNKVHNIAAHPQSSNQAKDIHSFNYIQKGKQSRNQA